MGNQEETAITITLRKDFVGLKSVELMYGGEISLQIKFGKNGRIIFECRKKGFLGVMWQVKF